MPAFCIGLQQVGDNSRGAFDRARAGNAGGAEPPRLIVELPPGEIYAGQTFKVRVSLLDPGDGTVQGISQPHVSGESIFSEPISLAAATQSVTTARLIQPSLMMSLLPHARRPGAVGCQGHSLSTRMIPGQPGAFQSFNALVDSEPVMLTVKPLPKEGQLPGFTGAIGAFNWSRRNSRPMKCGQAIRSRSPSRSVVMATLAA